MADRLNLTGAWFGHYVLAGARGRKVQFIAALTEVDGHLTGTISEPNPAAAPTSDYLNAIVSGTRTGTRVAFVKAYDGAGDFAHAVDYEGLLSAGGDCLSGQWRIVRSSAPFRMTRTSPGEEETIEDAVPTEVTV